MKLVTTVRFYRKQHKWPFTVPGLLPTAGPLLFLLLRHLHLLFACDRFSLCKTRLLSNHNLTPTAPRCWYFLKILMSPPPPNPGAWVRTCLCPWAGPVVSWLLPYFLVSSRIFSQSFSSTIYIFDSISYQNSLPLEDVFLAIFLQFSPLFSVLYMYTLICL